MSEEFSKPLLAMTLQSVFSSDDQGFAGDEAASRDLGLCTATGGVFSARRVRLGKDADIGPVASDPSAWFSFAYVLAGSAVVRTESGQNVTLNAHDAVTQLFLTPVTVIQATPHFEFLELQAPNTDETRKILPHAPKQTVSLDSPEAHEVGIGPRSFFDYRGLGVAEATDDLVEIQVVRAQRAKEGGTGWHSHDMSQLTFGLKGWGMLDVEGVPEKVCHRLGDAISIPAHWRHNASSFSNDYWALQLQVPANYQTFVREAPESVESAQ